MVAPQMRVVRGEAGASPALLEAGFRPFFLLASAYAVLGLGRWLGVYAGVLEPPGTWPASFWHAHEMLFGFVAAAIAGFLLTAVPTWTQTPRVRGAPLAGLAALWLAGRVALWWVDALPPLAVAVLDVAFLPALALAVGRPIARAGRRHNYPVLGVLALLAAIDVVCHLEVARGDWAGVRSNLYAALYAVVVLLAIISGRIVPLFTRNALRRRGLAHPVTSSPRVEAALFVTLAAAVVLALVAETGAAAGAASLACGGLFALRQARWQPHRSLGDPLLWVLHAGHAWLAVGFACLGLAAFWGALPRPTALHALTAGAIGTSIVGVLTRVSLGHTGRALRATPAMVAAYALVIAGAAVRVFGPLLGPDAFATTVLWGGGLWTAGFLLALAASAPLLLRPRTDAGPG